MKTKSEFKNSPKWNENLPFKGGQKNRRTPRQMQPDRDARPDKAPSLVRVFVLLERVPLRKTYLRVTKVNMVGCKTGME